MSDQPQKVAPFYCGSQRADWKFHNCFACVHGYDDAARTWRCDLERGLDESYMGDGHVTRELAAAIGMPDDCRVHNWRCPKFEAAPPRPPPPVVYRAVNKPAPWIEDWLKTRNNTSA